MLNDEFILENFFTKNGKINKYRLNKATEEELYFLKNRYSYFDSISEVLFRIKNNIEIRPVCEICGKPVIFWGTNRNPFSKTCSSECSKILNKQNREQTNLIKYGYENAAKSPEIKYKQSDIYHNFSENKISEIDEKRRQTNLNKYGVDNCFQSSEKKLLSKQTKLEKYGDENYNNIEKNKHTKLERYGNENYNNIAKNKQTKLERYGDENYNNPEKSKQTCIERYGVSSHMKLPKYRTLSSLTAKLMWTDENIVNKIKDTNLAKYNAPFYLQSDEFKRYITKLSKTLEYIQKRKQTCLDKYGCEFVLQSTDFKNRSRKTCIEKYGYKYYTQQPEFRRHLSELMLTNEYKEKINEIKRQNGTFHTSKPEDTCYEILKEKYPDIIRQYRDKRYPFNCDFYIPSKDLFIEFNGSWTHGGKPYEGTIEDKLVVESWIIKNTKYYNNAINTWTKRDVEKRKIAKENGLNYIELWSLNDLYLKMKTNIL